MAADASRDTLAPLRDWFSTWENYVRAVDYTSARQLFDRNVASFGTHAEIVFGLDRLVAEQWSAVWPNIADFRFEVDKLHGGIAGDCAWAAVPWTSTGFHEDGTAFTRPGRATVTFRRQRDHWLGIHTHFSLKPGTPPRTYGRHASGP
jgi:ketosteroid isomerase-like protein